MYPPNAFKRIFSSGMRLAIFLLPVLFLVYGVFAQTRVPRSPLKKTTIKISPTIPSGSCPTDIDQGRLPNHISICGYVKTAGINEEAGIQYAQEPIEGATVAVYLGASQAQGIPSGWEILTEDINGTGEIAGKIDGLYMYNITNRDGAFVVSAPKGVGTQGMLFLAFFCGQTIKDLYMLDSSKDLKSMLVSLACPPEVKPATNVPNTNGIPAPPSITYAIRGSYTSCETKAEPGQPGDDDEKSQTTSLPLFAEGLDNSRLNARVTQMMTGECQQQMDRNGNYYFRVIKEKPVKNSVPYFWQDAVSTPTIIGDEPRYLEVPPTNVLLSRRDLEGFTHSSLGYSLQSISSLNCGVGGCYDVVPPAMEKSQRLTVNRDKVFECNTSVFAPLNCKGPGIELAEPGEWTRSYYDPNNRDVEIFKTPSTRIRDITLPQYSSIGQAIQETLAALGIILSPVGPEDPLENLRQQQLELKAAQESLGALKAAADAFTKMIDDINTILNLKSVADVFNNLGTILSLAKDMITVPVKFFGLAKNISTPLILSLAPAEFAPLINSVLETQGTVDSYVAAIKNEFDTVNAGNIPAFIVKIAGLNADFVRDMVGNVKQLVLDLIKTIANLINVIPERIEKLRLGIAAIQDITLTTTDHDYFPYSSLLNYNILGKFNWHFENRPTNDSYVNIGGANSCLSGEMDRQQTSSWLSPTIYIGWYPFKACYGGVLLAQDTYSTQKALYTTTKNTDKAVTDKANDPVVSKFLMPGEEVGKEVNFTGTITSPVRKTPKVGQGYWRLGVVNTVCSHGVSDPNGGYPVLAVLGAEGALNATPDWP